MTDPSGCGGSESALSVTQARDTLLSAISAVAGWETVPIRSALGRVLMRDVIAPFDVPAHDNSAMDGYAVRAEDLSGSGEPPGRGRHRLCRRRLLRRGGAGPGGAGDDRRGAAPGRGLGGGAGSRPGWRATQVILPAVRTPGQNVRRAGEDLAAGKPALTAGKKIGPSELGLMASLGFAEVTVRRRPASPSSPPATSWPPSAAPWRRGRSTTATATPCSGRSPSWAWTSWTWAWCGTTRR
jgi:molybdopterin molybdotransferase